MRALREFGIDDVLIHVEDRKLMSPAPGPRPSDHPDLIELGL